MKLTIFTNFQERDNDGEQDSGFGSVEKNTDGRLI